MIKIKDVFEQEVELRHLAYGTLFKFQGSVFMLVHSTEKPVGFKSAIVCVNFSTKCPQIEYFDYNSKVILAKDKVVEIS